MFTRGSFVLRLIGVLLLVGLMIGGGVIAYRAGVTQGIAQSPAVATAISDAAQNGQALPVPAYGYRYGYGYPFWGFGPHFGFFPFGIFGFILIIFLFFGLMRLIFFRPWAWHYGHMHGRGPWKGYGPWGTPPWAREGEEGEAEANAEKENK